MLHTLLTLLSEFPVCAAKLEGSCTFSHQVGCNQPQAKIP